MGEALVTRKATGKMIDLRYHIYSLVAVFLALAVGVVIGTSFTATSPVAQQSGKLTRMERMVRRLEHDFTLVRAEIIKKQNEIHVLQIADKRNEEFSRAALPLILKNRLAWRNIAIVQTGAYDISGQMKTALELAGAQVTSVTKILDPRLLDDSQSVDALTTKLALPSPAAGQHKASPILQTLAVGLVSARDQEILAKMEELKIITRSGEYNRWNKLVVVVGGGAKKGQNFAERVDAPFIEELRKTGVVVVGCEPSDAVESYMRTYRKTDIATVDNADKSAGQAALVCALAGEAGHFGIKPTADRFLPESIEGRRR